MNWKALLAGLVLGLAPALLWPAPARAADDKKFDPKTEADKAAAEDAQERADRAAGKKGLHQRRFYGTFLLPSDPTAQANPDVVGTFVTDETDPKPNRTYQVKVENGNKEILASLQRNDAKKVGVQGKLRVDDKYLIVSGVTEPAPSPPAKERRSAGGV